MIEIKIIQKAALESLLARISGGFFSKSMSIPCILSFNGVKFFSKIPESKLEEAQINKMGEDILKSPGDIVRGGEFSCQRSWEPRNEWYIEFSFNGSIWRSESAYSVPMKQEINYRIRFLGLPL